MDYERNEIIQSPESQINKKEICMNILELCKEFQNQFTEIVILRSQLFSIAREITKLILSLNLKRLEFLKDPDKLMSQRIPEHFEILQNLSRDPEKKFRFVIGDDIKNVIERIENDFKQEELI